MCGLTKTYGGQGWVLAATSRHQGQKVTASRYGDSTSVTWPNDRAPGGWSFNMRHPTCVRRWNDENMATVQRSRWAVVSTMVWTNKTSNTYINGIAWYWARRGEGEKNPNFWWGVSTFALNTDANASAPCHHYDNTFKLVRRSQMQHTSIRSSFRVPSISAVFAAIQQHT